MSDSNQVVDDSLCNPEVIEWESDDVAPRQLFAAACTPCHWVGPTRTLYGTAMAEADAHEIAKRKEREAARARR